jgi:F0F1-type ATP synthase assembly protein I
VARVGLIVREGLLFGFLAGIFALIVRIVAVVATNDLNPSMLSNFITPALGALIIGGAGRKLAAMTRASTPGLQMGALAGGISELFRTIVADIFLSYLPAGQAAFNHLTPTQKAAAADTSKLIVNLGFELGLAILFGALLGWLGAWSLLQFRPPREPGA